MTKAFEVNFDGLPGLTHNYAGLSFGNVASGKHAQNVSNPREAALQGLEKMRRLAAMGLKQAVLPPHERPHVHTLRRLGFGGTDAQVIADAWRADPALARAVYSASPMWTANAATISPSADTGDAKVHFTPANLVAMFHRSIEHEVTGRVLKAIFANNRHFQHHPALPSVDHLGDEGAANHTRFAPEHGAAGVEFFVYGKKAFDKGAPQPQKFPARQTLEASQSVARLHGLYFDKTVFAQQNSDLIDAGVFHNDVVSVGNGHVLFHYENAFVDTPGVFEDIRRKLNGTEFIPVEVPAAKVPLQDVVASYLFNSQLLTMPDGRMLLLLPIESQEIDSVRRFVEELVASNGPIREAMFMDLRQSMRNGGGPACLRLRVVLTEAEMAAANQAVFVTPDLADRLEDWVKRRYRDRMSAEDLRDPQLLVECREALDELTGILQLGPVYDFQRA